MADSNKSVAMLYLIVTLAIRIDRSQWDQIYITEISLMKMTFRRQSYCVFRSWSVVLILIKKNICATPLSTNYSNCLIVEDDDLKVGSIILQEHQVHEWDHNSAGMKPIKKNTKEYQKVIPETRRAH
jgi:hypothetical protein